jgi:hypothetical protein
VTWYSSSNFRTRLTYFYIDNSEPPCLIDLATIPHSLSIPCLIHFHEATQRLTGSPPHFISGSVPVGKNTFVVYAATYPLPLVRVEEPGTVRRTIRPYHHTKPYPFASRVYEPSDMYLVHPR